VPQSFDVYIDVFKPDLLERAAATLRYFNTHEVRVGLFKKIVPVGLLTGAWVSEFGTAIPKTPKMRRFLAAMARKYGIKLDPTKGDPNYVIIPCRSFIRSAIDEHGEELLRLAQEMTIDALHGDKTPQQAMASIGAKLQQVIVMKIRSITEPPLHPLTAAMGRKEKPFGRGTLMRSITFEVAPREG